MQIQKAEQGRRDIGHWDVPDVLEVVPEAYEMLEHGMLNGDDFKRFTFGNAVRLHGGMNPDFFKGTVVKRRPRLNCNRIARRQPPDRRAGRVTAREKKTRGKQ